MRRHAAASAILVAAALTMVAQTPMRSTWDGVYTAAQADRGRDLYEVQCAGCHGDQLEGDVVEHPALAGGTFRDKWNGQTVADLFERIHRDMPMDNPGTLTRKKSADLTAFLLSANGYPAGNQDLADDLAPLREIRIDEVKPAHKK